VTSSGPSAATRDGEYAHLVPLQRRYAALAADDPARQQLREQLISGYRPIAEHIARRFVGRGEPLDDLVQVAIVGLINAVDRFEPDRGCDFFSFAVPTITGEVRRYFRDHGWSTRVPRRLKDLHIAMRGTLADLHVQREQIQNTRANLLESEGYVDRSVKTLRGMARRMATNRIITAAIIAVLILMIFGVIYSKFS